MIDTTHTHPHSPTLIRLSPDKPPNHNTFRLCASYYRVQSTVPRHIHRIAPTSLGYLLGSRILRPSQPSSSSYASCAHHSRSRPSSLATHSRSSDLSRSLIIYRRHIANQTPRCRLHQSPLSSSPSFGSFLYPSLLAWLGACHARIQALKSV